MLSASEKRIFPTWSLIGAVLFFGVLWQTDFPKPTYDDLFYLGSGLNLAQGGDLSNPLLARQQFPSHFFFLYPPLHSYVVAGWLKVFGISAASVTGLPILLYLIITGATIAILRRHSAPVWLEWLVPLAVSFSLVPAGLRTEPLAIALTMSGFAILECCRPKLVLVFTAFLLLFLGASASPRNAPFVAMLAGLSFYKFWRLFHGKPVPYLTTAAAALLITALAFLAMIHFQLREFLAVFHLHASQVSASKFGMFLAFIKSQQRILYPVWGAFFGLLALSIFRRSKNPLTHLGILMAVTLAAEAVIGSLVPHIIWYMAMAVLVLAGSLLKGLNSRVDKVIALGLFIIFAVANCKTLAVVAGTETGKIQFDVEPDHAQILAIRPTFNHPLLLDCGSARYLYGYRIPAGSIDVGFAAAFPGSFVTCDELHPGDIYVVGSGTLIGLERDTYLPPAAIESWAPLGIGFLRSERHPFRSYVIASEECKAVRPEVPWRFDPTGAARARPKSNAQ